MSTEKFNFENLKVWQEAVSFSEKIYAYTKSFPKHEQYGLTNQIRRSSTSIALNIAEGKGRYSKKEFVQFLYHARGSLYEVITCIELALKLNILDEEIYKELRQDASKLLSQLSGLINSIKNTPRAQSPEPRALLVQ